MSKFCDFFFTVEMKIIQMKHSKICSNQYKKFILRVKIRIDCWNRNLNGIENEIEWELVH